MRTAELHDIFLKSNKACTDTRKIEKGDLYFALKGDRFDGNTFAQQALDAGADYAVIDDKTYYIDDRTILVNDSLKALQELANYHRKFLKLPIIALTGSNGKTTTKELINAVLSRKYKTVATIGNLNNHIGVPLTLLSMNTSTEIGIVEMGANHKKEIEFLCTIAEPDYGYITNFGKAHLEGFGGVEGVIQGKSELYEHLKKNGKTIFYNGEDKIQLERLQGYKTLYGFGEKVSSDVQIHFLGADPFAALSFDTTTITSQLIGAYNLSNMAAAVTIGLYFKVPAAEIKAGIEAYIPSNNRSQIIEKNGNKIIMDAYNANPTSMKAALDNFSKLSDTPKLAIIGDMFELGPDAAAEHQYIAGYAETLGLQNVLLVGSNFYQTKTNYLKFNTFEDLKAYLSPSPPKNNTILIKGSRGMALERVLEVI